VGKDYRIGLVMGLVLALAALFWVATRPSLNPQVRTAPVSQLAQIDTAPPRPWEKAAPPAGTGQPERADRSATSAGNAGPARAREPMMEARNPATDARAPQRGSTSTRAEPLPAPTPEANPTALPDLTIYQKAEKIKTTKFHIVQRGETLSGISRQYYGSPDQWRKILATNEKIIKDPNRLAPGTKLIIPE
jgi:nucleoid-associated protein YgaU